MTGEAWVDVMDEGETVGMVCNLIGAVIFNFDNLILV